jgi:hypothetical protein
MSIYLLEGIQYQIFHVQYPKDNSQSQHQFQTNFIKKKSLEVTLLRKLCIQK